MTSEQATVADGDRCTVIAGLHKGKIGSVESLNRSKGGNFTITVRQSDGARIKTLARNVVKS